MKHALVHIDKAGARMANGGFLMLSLLAQEMTNMGYLVHVFDVEDRLEWNHFAWLNIADPKFHIGRFYDVAHRSDAPIVTGWISALMDGDELVPGIDIDRVRVWSGSIIRDGMEAERALANRMPRIWSVNEGLLEYYRRAGYKGDVIPLENWIRSDLFYPEAGGRVDGRIGYQTDNFIYSIEAELRDRFGDHVLLCEGTQAEVAAKMRSCDYFISWNRQFDCFQEVGLLGETFNLSMFEAMACGCITASRTNTAFAWHHARYHLSQWDILKSAMDTIEVIDDEWTFEQREEMRNDQFYMVDSYFRFDEHRKSIIKEMVDDVT